MKRNIEKILLNKAQTLRDALTAINADVSLKIAIVVDEEKKLIGVVTDGDVRRALLANYTLESKVSEIMNHSPAIATTDYIKEDLMALMVQKGILAIPIVKEGVVIGVETYNDASIPDEFENPVFIMAGGFGTRLRPLTDNCPKPLLEVGGRPLLETVILGFKKSGFKNFYISTHYLPEMIKNYFGKGDNWGVNIIYVHEDEPLGTGGALGLLPKDIPNLPIVMINGDVLTTIDFKRLLEFHNQNKAIATMCVREHEYQVPYGVVKGNGHNIVGMEEKPVHSFFVNAGIYVIEPEVTNLISTNEYIDMPTLLGNVIEENEDVLMFPIHEYWLDIGRMEDFNKAQYDYISLGFQDESLGK